MMKKIPLDLILAIIVFAIGALLLQDRFADPPFWDEIKVYFKPLWQFLESPSNFLLRREPDYAERPPGLLFLYFPILTIFGESVFLVRIQNYCMFGFSLYFLYKCFSVRLTQKSRFVAAISIFYTLTIPSFTIYATQFVGAPQLLFLISLQLYLFFYWPKSFIFQIMLGFLAGFSRETALAFAPAYLFFLLDVKYDKKQIICNSMAIILGFGANTILNFYRFGDFSQHLAVTSGHLFSKSLVEALKTFQSHFLLPYKLHFLVFTSVIAIAFHLRKFFKVPDPVRLFLISVSLSFLVLFLFHSFSIVRYFWIIVPFVSYLTFSSFMSLGKGKKLGYISVFFAFLFSAYIGDPNSVTEKNFFYRFIGPESSYENKIYIKKISKLISKLKANVAENDHVIAGWPFREILLSENMGYGKKINLKINKARGDDIFEDIENPKAILWTNYPEQISIQELKVRYNLERYDLDSFQKGDYKVQLYLLKE